MSPLLRKGLAIVTLAMSIPLFLSYQLQTPPVGLRGLPFVVLWSWGVVSAVAVPILVALEFLACIVIIARGMGGRFSLALHVIALVVALCAESIFILARRSMG